MKGVLPTGLSESPSPTHKRDMPTGEKTTLIRQSQVTECKHSMSLFKVAYIRVFDTPHNNSLAVPRKYAGLLEIQPISKNLPITYN
jgi:hypothetical protein